MSVLTAIANLGLIFKDDDFIAFAILFYNSHDSGAINIRLADGYFITIGQQQNFVQFYTAAFFFRQTVND
jgi:hypothetical protein